jgi:hypothetical protein
MARSRCVTAPTTVRHDTDRDGRRSRYDAAMHARWDVRAAAPRLPGLLGPIVQVFLGVFDREGRVQRRRRIELGRTGTVGE